MIWIRQNVSESYELKYSLDTNVVIRFQDAGSLDAISRLTGCELVLTDYVWDEVTRKPGVGKQAEALLRGLPHVVRRPFMPNEPVTRHFDRLRRAYNLAKYHDGELSVIALAACEPDLIPVIYEFRGHVAACDELRRLVMTGHWFFKELADHHGLPGATLSELVDLLDAKNYPRPTWHSPSGTGAKA